MEQVKSVDLRTNDVFEFNDQRGGLKWRVADLATVKMGEDSKRKLNRTYIYPIGLGKGTLSIEGDLDVTILKRGDSMREIRYGKHRGKKMQDVSHGWLRWARREATSIFDREQLEWIDTHVEKYQSES